MERDEILEETSKNITIYLMKCKQNGKERSEVLRNILELDRSASTETQQAYIEIMKRCMDAIHY